MLRALSRRQARSPVYPDLLEGPTLLSPWMPFRHLLNKIMRVQRCIDTIDGPPSRQLQRWEHKG